MINDNRANDTKEIKMNFRYKISRIDEATRWIFVSPNSEDGASFVKFIKHIQGDKKLTCVGDIQYSIEGDPFELVYQWDYCFGIVVIYNNMNNKDSVLSFLQGHINRLNEMG